MDVNQPKDFVNVEIATTEDRESIQNLERLFFVTAVNFPFSIYKFVWA